MKGKKFAILLCCSLLMASSTASAATYTVEHGDTLWGIAKLFYDNGFRYHEIYELNTDLIQDPNRIYPGMQLTLPVVDGESSKDTVFKRKLWDSKHTANSQILIGETVAYQEKLTVISNPECVKVDENGYFTGVKPGKITVQREDGTTENLIVCYPGGYTIGSTDCENFYYISDTKKVVSAKSSDTNVVTVSIKALDTSVSVSSHGEGTASVTIAYEDGSNLTQKFCIAATY